MGYSHSLDIKWRGPGDSESQTITKSGTAQIMEELAFLNGAANVLKAIAFPVSALKFVYLCSDKDVLVETNSSSAPDDLIHLKAGVPYIWYEGAYDSCVFAATVTAFYLTNEGTGNGNLQVVIVYDA